MPGDVSVMAGGESGEASEAPEPVPAEIAAIAGSKAGSKIGDKAGSEGAPEGSLRRLRSIPAHPEAELAEAQLAQPLAVRRRRRPQLRLVK